MKLEFPGFGGGGGASLPLSRRLIERRMRQFDVQPLDDTRRTIRFGVIAAALFFGLFGLFALLVPINGAAIAPGQVSVAGSRLVVQPITSGLVAEMLVHEGQQVRAGQPLVRLNGVRSGATLRQAQAKRDALRATGQATEQSVSGDAEVDGGIEVTIPLHLETSVEYQTDDESAGWSNRTDVVLTVSTDAVLGGASEAGLAAEDATY